MGNGRRPGHTPRALIALVIAVTFTGATPAPASAGLLGGVLDLVDTTVDSTLEVVDGVGGLLLGDGWLYDPNVSTSLSHVREVIGAKKLAQNGITGEGVGVALLDTGVVPVAGVANATVANGPDLSFESQAGHLRYLDTYGHGTHMAGIIAGRDSDRGFRGVAPDATLVSVKLAPADGATDVSQVIAAIDWVVAHRNDPGMNLRVLNLSYGTNGAQDYRYDPLAHAVENAWRHGIVVVVAGGNDGSDQPRLNNPALDPYVIAVGAADTAQTVSTYDDTVSPFSSRGSSARRVDLVAPGRSIVSLRNPGSAIDTTFPGAQVDTRYFKGSGTSQAAAVVAGAAALLLEQRPSLTPDQVKAMLKSTASPMPKGDAAGRGAGMVNVAAAAAAAAPAAAQTWTRSTGVGSLEAARGDAHVGDNDVELRGEHHVLGPWAATTWAPASAAGTAWNGGSWLGYRFAGDCWCGSSWSTRTWAAAAWTGTSWSGASWTGRTWHDDTWTGRTWHGSGWTGRTWHGATWTGRTWHGAAQPNGEG